MRNYVPRSAPLIRNSRHKPRGMGADCGDNPCTWWDDVYLRNACMAYLACADPANPLLVMSSPDQGGQGRGLIVGGSQVVGSTIGQALETGAESVAVNPATGQMNWLAIGLIGIGLLLVVPRLVSR